MFSKHYIVGQKLWYDGFYNNPIEGEITLIGHVIEYPTMHYLRNPRQSQSMTAYMILDKYSWKFQWKILILIPYLIYNWYHPTGALLLSLFSSAVVMHIAPSKSLYFRLLLWQIVLEYLWASPLLLQICHLHLPMPVIIKWSNKILCHALEINETPSHYCHVNYTEFISIANGIPRKVHIT